MTSRIVVAVAACAVVGALAGCKQPSWNISPELHVFAKSYQSPYDTAADLASVTPGLDVTGESRLRAALAAKLAADHVGHDGHVRVDISSPGATEHKGVIDVQVHVVAAWGTPVGRVALDAHITGKVRFTSNGDVIDDLNRSISEYIAGEVEKLFFGVEPKAAYQLPAPPPATQVAVDLHMGCSLHADGTVRCWGHQLAPLGAVPVPITGMTGAKQIAVDDQLGCALLAGGTAACWTPRRWADEPKLLDAYRLCGVDHLVAISGSCGVRDDGTVACWDEGDLEDGAGGCTNAATLAQFGTVPHVAGATQVATSAWHACALDAKHHVSCWPACDKDCAAALVTTTPVAIPELAGATAIGVGGVVCGVMVDGVRCASPDPKGMPLAVASYAIANAVQLAVGMENGVARTADGKLVGWGGASAELPAGVTATGVAGAGMAGTCMVGAAGDVWCAPDGRPLARVVYAAGSAVAP